MRACISVREWGRTLSFITMTHDVLFIIWRFRMNPEFVRSHQSHRVVLGEIDISINLCHLTSGSHSFPSAFRFPHHAGPNKKKNLIPTWVVTNGEEGKLTRAMKTFDYRAKRFSSTKLTHFSATALDKYLIMRFLIAPSGKHVAQHNYVLFIA